jgi:hypothetical protein
MVCIAIVKQVSQLFFMELSERTTALKESLREKDTTSSQMSQVS